MRDPAFIEKIRPLLERYVSWYRPVVTGWEHLPDSGPFLVVGNHSGGATPPDMPILLTAWWRERGVQEPVYGLFHATVLGIPGVRSTLERAGAVDADPARAEELLRSGAVVIAYPGGDHDAFRPWTRRNHIDMAGRTGFIRLAARTGAPIVPVVTAGVQDTIFVLSRGEKLARFYPPARIMRLKVVPIVAGLPWGLSPGLPTIPLPGRARVRIMPPVTADGDPDDAAWVSSMYETISEGMQDTLDELVS